MFSHEENRAELLRVERPGRYLGGEIGAVPNLAPDARGRLLRVALCFPDVYEIAHSHLGHKILYSLINDRAGLSAERLYAPWPDWEEALRRQGRPLASLERGRPLSDFDVVGFSLQYELGYTTILNMLKLGGLPLAAGERGDRAPLVCAGGPGAYNPEPLADFFDLFFLGDAEASFVEDLELIKEWRFEKAPKSELYDRLAGRPGIYIPSLFEPRYTASGRFAGLTPLKAGYHRVARAAAPSLERAPFPLGQITPFCKPVHDRVIVEIGRGCSRGCRFCQAGYIYRPVRERRRETVLALAEANLAATGQDEVSFLSLSAGDHSQIAALVSGFMDRYADQAVALSLPSLRVKSLTGHLARQIRRVRKTGFTLAPEAGTQRLRQVINKDLTEDDLLAAADLAFSLGWRTLKLYFMVGLPTETDEDLAAIGHLVRRVKKMSRARLNLGVAHFTPKAHTPFQWHPAATAAEIRRRLNRVREAAQAPGLIPKWNEPGASWVESLIARGDRRLGRALRLVHEKGARFEAWSDHFKAELWTQALAEAGLTESFLLHPFDPGDPLPFQHLFAGVEQDFLREELALAYRAAPTPDCRRHGCRSCGACGDGVAVDLAGQGEEGPPEEVPGLPASRPVGQGAAFLVNFSKEGRAAFLGHLELVEVFKRACRRAGLKLALSEGFHPQPKLSFLTALPLGVPSRDEYLRLTLAEPLPAEELRRRLAARLPEGLSLKRVAGLPAGRPKPAPRAAAWRVVGERPVFIPGPPLHPGAQLRYTDAKGRARHYDLAEFVVAAEARDPRTVDLTIRLGLAGAPKPQAAALALWGLDPDQTATCLYKLETILEI